MPAIALLLTAHAAQASSTGGPGWSHSQHTSRSQVLALPCAGLAGIALDLPITISESNAGLTPPAVAYALLGKGGAVLIVIIVFMVSPFNSLVRVTISLMVTALVWM